MNLVTPKNRLKRYFQDIVSGEVHSSIERLTPSSLDLDALRFFLSVGYVPGKKTLFEKIQCLPGGLDLSRTDNDPFQYKTICDKDQYIHASFSELVAHGVSIFQKSFASSYEKIKDQEVIIPLSGGLDSRLILGFANQYLSGSTIKTFTFGIPGTYDFEIGNKIGQRLSKNHDFFNLNKIEVRHEILQKTALCTDFNTNIYEPYYFIYALTKYGYSPLYLSGYTGDGIAGSHFSTSYNRSWTLEQEMEYYLKHEMHSRSPYQVHELNQEYLELNAYKDALTVQEALFFENHVERYSVNHVIPTGYNFMAPFMTDEIIAFLWSIPDEYRVSKELFNAILLSLFPEIFSFPVKQNFGASLASKNRTYFLKQWFRARLALKKFGIRPGWQNPMTNYVNFGMKMLDDKIFINDLKGLFSELEKRELPLPVLPSDVLKQHSLQNDQSKLLMLLASLEVILRTKMKS